MTAPEATAGAGAAEAGRDELLRQMDRLLRPRAIAVVGASRTPGYGQSILLNIPRYGFKGGIYGVNPRYDDIEGVPCFPDLASIPEDIDHVILVVPNALIPSVLEQCEAKGVGAVNIISSGYGETGDDGSARQAELKAWAARTGIRVVGPNCLGLMSLSGHLNCTPYRYQNLRPGAVGMVLQSGMMGTSMVTPLLDRQIGVSYCITSGNEADLETADYIRYFLDDPDIRVIGAFTEQVRSPERFIEVAELAADLKKPIVMLKIGRTEAARRSAAAHTGSLVGADDVFEALVRRLGVIRVNSINQFVETVAVMHTPRLPKGGRIVPIVVSGGAAGMISDLGADDGLDFPTLPPATVKKLEAIIPEFGTVGNPLDITAMGALNPTILKGSFDAVAEVPDVDILMYGRGLPAMIDAQAPQVQALQSIIDRYPDKLLISFALVGGNFRERGQPHVEVKEPIAALGGIPLLEGGTEYALRAVGQLIRYADFIRQRQPGVARSVDRLLPASVREQARQLVQAGAASGEALTERAGKEILALYGIPTTAERLATTPDEAVAAARAIGYPVVLKIESPEITHKTEAGGVKIGIDGDDAVRAAFAEIIAGARRYNPAATIAGVLVQEMVGKGHELILGSTRDPQYGSTVLVGLGGIFVEVLKDTALRLPPISDTTAREMLASLRGARVLDGVRGLPAADLPALTDTIRRFGELVQDLGDLVAEIDINPLIAFGPGGGVKAVDCLVVRGDGVS